MSGPRAYVGNAADEKQVRRAGGREWRNEERRLDLYRVLLSTSAGRAVCWDLLSQAGVFVSIFSSDAALMAYRAGQQDFGHEFIGLLTQADEDGYLLVEREARARAKRDALTTDASHTAGVTAPEDSDGT